MKLIDLEQNKEEKNKAPSIEQNKKEYAKLTNMKNWLKELESMMLKVDKEKLLLSKDSKKKPSNKNEDSVWFYSERKR